ncbi:PilC/PilY family type IV pilus protein [Variovorax paradoxus]|jgi:type IV pilus assembly protein PilY1|uniref:PilC/PilY family type IV pilus protein n=1 Tax=Variovorax paradoxus TaxID=34073 RepID=UPI0029C9AE3C|nr:PilC/PilY family type IV pilus protein [Variovorax paradoxus]WPH20442.1 PilC/PilY family type IV pilus protein [Variovorax paradoxus]
MTPQFLRSSNTGRVRRWRLAALCTLVPLGVLGFALSTSSQTSSTTDISNEPLATRGNVQAKPNLLFILDNSGSMNWSYMPDRLGVSSGTADQPYAQWYGYRTAQCNGIAYDPAVTYSPPVDSTGAEYTASSFSAAWPDGYTKDSTVNLAQATSITTSSISNGTGTKTFTMTAGTYSSSTFTEGDAVTITSTTNSAASMSGVITSWGYSNTWSGRVWSLEVLVSESAGSGSYTNWTVTLTPTYYTYKAPGTQAAVNWTYNSDGGVDTSTTFYQECTSNIGSTPGSNVFEKHTVTSTSAEATNYANWYSYYRKRYLLMRTAMGRAISPLNENYRVGFSTISDAGVVDGASDGGSGTGYFRDVKDFTPAQKANFYSSLYGSEPNGSTPLRVALAKAGRYFGKRFDDQYDPMQYSCQRNYALLSTDGYWNGGKGVQLDGTTTIGQQDGNEVRPMVDDATGIVKTVVTYTASATATETRRQTRTRDWLRTATTVSRNSGGGCGNGRYRKTVQEQTYTQQTETQTSVTPQTGTASYTVTTVTTGGVSAAPVTSPTVFSNWVYSGVATITNTFGTDAGPPDGGDWTNGTVLESSCQNQRGTGDATYSPSAAGSASWSALSNGTTSTSDATAGQFTASAPVTTSSSTGGTANTLADVAQYYYKTDLRNGSNCTSTSSNSSQDVCANIVRTTASDPADWQHMNTFTIGLGVSGTLAYDKNYLTQTAGSYADIVRGPLNWPAPGNADSTSGGGGDARNVDDLWHTAVNGRGQYYSALNAGLLAEAINGVVSTVKQVAGAGAAASTSSLELVAGNNNQVFRASYTTQAWTGDLQAFALNGADAVIGARAWSAQAQLDAATPANRNIYFNNSGTLQGFTYTNLSTALQANFDNRLCSTSLTATQCSLLSASDKTAANSGANLVNYLRGVRTHESQSVNASNTAVAALYRRREHVLGDIVNGAPVHVGKPPFSYSDTGYADFVAAKASRKNVVYVAANDGMLHAFSSDTSDGGTELWSFIPTAVMPNLYKLADSAYGANHQYFVDGAPVMGDIKVGNTWKTILVGGLNSGGKSYYALDITDPTSPSMLWEFTDQNLGYSYGNPVITKKADGTWVVVFASGYNNTGGDGKGHLFVLNANTGEKLQDIATTAGTVSAPSGLAKINAWIDDAANNTSKRFYGGDMLGNLWRFDIDGLIEPRRAALKLATFQVGTTPQPITTKPETVEITGKPVIIVGTGRYLGQSDITDSTQQSVYAVKDPLTNNGWGDVRADTTNFVRQTFTLAGTEAEAKTASVSNNAINFSTKAGWWIDLPHSKERIATNLGLQLNTLAIATAIPNGDACAAGGSSWRYYLNAATGGVVTTNPAGMQWSENSLIVGMSWVKDSNGNIRIIYQRSNGDLGSEVPPTGPPSGNGSAHRTSWRELVN